MTDEDVEFLTLFNEKLKEMTDEEKEKIFTLWYEHLKKNNPDHPFFMDTLVPFSLLLDVSKATKQMAKEMKKKMTQAMKKGNMGSDPFL